MKWFTLLLFLCPVVFVTESTTHCKYKDVEDRIVREVERYVETGVESHDLLEDMHSLSAPNFLRTRFLKSFEDQAICVLCRVAARLIMTYRRFGGSRNLAIQVANKICVWAKIEDAKVCEGVINLNMDILLYIIDNTPDLTPTRACSLLAQDYNCEPTEEDKNWSVILPPYPDEPAPQIVNTDVKPLRILQITDMHFDDDYVIGGNAECSEPLCCGADQGNAEDEEAKAGSWGDYRSCDMPWHTVKSFIDQLKTQQFDMVYFTGDVTNHRVWQTSREKNINDIKKMYGELKKLYKDTPLFGIIGNHETNPVNVFAPVKVTDENYSSKWLYDLMAEELSFWIPKEAQDTIKKGGFYTVLVKPGFRIIVLNNNVAYNLNFWLLYDDVDPDGQLQWLTNTLAKAEQDGELVHILAHIPNGDTSCYKKWSHEYNRIINRFAHVIPAQFNGHTHYDEMILYYNSSDLTQPINIAYNGGSFTTFVNVNPNYRIYTVNPKTYIVDDFDQWTFNLTAANMNDLSTPPTWYKLYSIKEAYGLASLDLKDIHDLVEKIPTDQKLLDQYYRFKVREALPSMEMGCDDKCNEGNICNLVSSEHGDKRKCNALVNKYKKFRATKR